MNVYLYDDGPTVTEAIRERLRVFMGPCPSCGKTQRTYREAGTELDLSGSVLHRFLKGGGVDSDTLDQLDARLPVPPTDGEDR